ncbi:amidohydrolase family protein [Sphingomonas immobilis]|uniref:Amidohydrolase family protein n=1 Tax=Sphingomonas immobilis TaxID=3063997 RepID=A0ABT9A2C9_9SPHN|nr:amidohydrolase family protein [Sphingomonas sp. CA1-15]MDO7842872.1 amidohydrolase family protein [Sphingomonas sp. CA1-15]
MTPDTLSDTAPQVATMGYRAIDADGHYYEPHDAFTRHLESRFSNRALRVEVSSKDGLGRLFYGDKKLGMMKVTQTDYTGAPGSRADFFQGLIDDEEGWHQSEVISAHDHPAMMNRDARIALMDRQGIEATLLFPTVGVAVEHEMHDDVDALYAGLRAFNRWLEDDWGYGADGRIFGAPMMSLVDPEQGCAELERVLRAGARILHMKRGPVYGASIAHPSRDRFWAMVQEADIPLAFHIGDAGYHELWGTQWGEEPRPPVQYTSPFQVYLASTAMEDTIANLILNNLFDRFPKLRILSVENGSEWAKGLTKRMNKAAFQTRGQAGLGGPVTCRPADVLRQNFYICPFFEEDPVELAELIGADKVLFGSDWPHPEGLAEPLDFADKLIAHGDGAMTRRIMRSNMAKMIGLAA